MLKRIHTHDLRLGMYLHDLCGSWMETPFWRTRFLLKDPKDLVSIQGTAIQECWIDTDKGIDVRAGTASVSREEVDALIETDFKHLDGGAPLPDSPAPPPPVRDHTPTDMARELQIAASICSQSRQAVESMFNEARMGTAVDEANAKIVVDKITDSVTRNPHALVSLARLKTADDYTYMHSVAVCALMVALAKQLKLDEPQVRLAGMAGLLHDLGKARVPLSVLNKPGRLTDLEFAVVRSHPQWGYQMLQQGGKQQEAVLDACLHHHERVDGRGYPDQLQGEDISMMARMTAVCDVYDAITSNRPYKAGWDPAESLRRMSEWTHDHFDQRIFHAFVKSIGIYPVGSLVRLSSGRLGVVVEPSRTALTKPIVKVFFSTKSGLRIPPEIVDLAKTGTEKLLSREAPEDWNFSDLNELWSGLSEKTLHSPLPPSAPAPCLH
ncbi:MAG: HD-GYP domain-containing protein [Burkholderiaceae bacterium]|nr:HD-GYP domain-containing protein [Burkholderiaceae bacterium]